MTLTDAIRSRILQLCEEHKLSIHSLAIKAAVPPSSIKNILYGKSVIPGIVTIKMLCDGFGITLTEFFGTEDFLNLEQEMFNILSREVKAYGLSYTDCNFEVVNGKVMNKE